MADERNQQLVPEEEPEAGAAPQPNQGSNTGSNLNVGRLMKPAQRKAGVDVDGVGGAPVTTPTPANTPTSNPTNSSQGQPTQAGTADESAPTTPTSGPGSPAESPAQPWAPPKDAANRPPVDTNAVGDVLPESTMAAPESQSPSAPAESPPGGEEDSEQDEDYDDDDAQDPGEGSDEQAGDDSSSNTAGERSGGSTTPTTPNPAELGGAGGGAGAGAAAGEAAEVAVASSGVWLWVGGALLVLAFIGFIVFIAVSGTAGDHSGKTNGSSTSAPGGGAVSGDVQQLAKDMLADKNITYWTTANGSTEEIVRALADGKQAYTTCGDTAVAPAKGTKVDINPNILKFIVEAGKKTHVMVNALTDKCHSSAGSNHYKGQAVDLDLNSGPLSILEPIARDNGGTKNNETSHHHFDFPAAGGNGAAGQPRT